MAADRRLALHATLPDRYAHLEVLASTIDHLGRLAALVADPAQGFTPSHFPSVLRPPPHYNATAVICDGPEIHEIPVTDLDLWFTDIDTLGEGVVLAAARCGRPDVPDHLTHNLRVIEDDGQTRSGFYAGDGIEQLMTDARENIWTSYFDESSYLSPGPDSSRSRFMVGLARWDGDGNPPWMAPDHTPGVAWCDCYALNVGRDLVHACPYTDFPLVEINANGVRAVTPNPVTRCSGLAVAGSELAFFDQHRAGEGYRWEIRRARKRNGSVIETDREHLLLPDGRNPAAWARGKLGRDETLWLQENGDWRHWYRYDIDT